MKTRALYLADDLLNSSPEVQARLRTSMIEGHSETLKLIEEIVKTTQQYNLVDHNENLEFAWRIIKKLMLNGVWRDIDDVKNLISIVKKSQ